MKIHFIGWSPSAHLPADRVPLRDQGLLELEVVVRELRPRGAGHGRRGVEGVAAAAGGGGVEGEGAVVAAVVGAAVPQPGEEVRGEVIKPEPSVSTITEKVPTLPTTATG